MKLVRQHEFTVKISKVIYSTRGERKAGHEWEGKQMNLMSLFIWLILHQL